nr:urease accessory protein UreD [Thalassobius sp. Cn5-15]
MQTSGCLKLLFPQIRDGALTAVQLNTAGGITGGDQLDFTAEAEAGSHLRLTTQAAERIYRSPDQTAGRVTTYLRAERGARLDWLPQETILFDHSALHRCLHVDLTADARFLMVEPLVFGRAAMGEVLRQVLLRDQVRIRREGHLIYADGLRFGGDLHTQMQRMAIGGGAGAMATALLVAPEAECEALQNSLRPMLPDTAGISRLTPDVLVLRAMAEDSFILRRDLIPALTLMNGADLPRTWMI